MCEYCKDYDTGNDFYPLVSMNVDLGVLGNADCEVFIERDLHSGKPFLYVGFCPSSSDEAPNEGVQINYCPFCGRKFKEG